MIDKEILGGVSPLKQKRQASRGGKSAKRATTTAKRRGGFAASKGKRGGGGRNVGGYNVQTRFKAGRLIAPVRGGNTIVFPGDKTSTDKKTKDPQSGREERVIPGEEAKTGNEFADNCYGAAGEKLTGTSYYSEKKGMQIACAWDDEAKDDGSFDYDKAETPDKKQYRLYTQKEKGGVKTFTEWMNMQK